MGSNQNEKGLKETRKIEGREQLQSPEGTEWTQLQSKSGSTKKQIMGDTRLKEKNNWQPFNEEILMNKMVTSSRNFNRGLN